MGVSGDLLFYVFCMSDTTSRARAAETPIHGGGTVLSHTVFLLQQKIMVNQGELFFLS